jgi:hypothetical protein
MERLRLTKIAGSTLPLEMFGRVFGGATAYPKAKGIWRDDERNGALVKDEPVFVHSYTTPADIESSKNWSNSRASAERWAATLVREKSGWWLATSISRSVSSRRSNR